MSVEKSSFKDEIKFILLDTRSVKDIAKIHTECLPEDVLPALGHDFLINYYKYVLEAKSHQVIGAFRKKELIGFCQFSFLPVSMIAVIKQKPFLLLFRILWLLISNPKLFVIGIAMSLWRPKNWSSIAEISFIAVHQDFQSQGIGTGLVEFINKIATINNIKKVITKTSNKAARLMYEQKFHAYIEISQKIFDREYWFLAWNPREHIQD